MASRIFLIGIVAGLAAAMGLAGVFSAISTQSAAQMMGGMHGGMMGNNNMMMTTTGNTPVLAHQVPWHWTNKASFGSNGISNVENVQITGISISSDKQVTVNLRYTGNGTTPSVVVVASAGSMGMMGDYGGMGMMGGGMHSGMMSGGMYGMGMMGSQMPMMGYGPYGVQMHTMWNDTQWQQWHNQMAQWHSQMSNQSWSNQTMNQNMMGMMRGHQMPMMGMPMGWQHHSFLVGSTALDSEWTSNAPASVTLVGDGWAYDTNNVSVTVYPLTS